MGLFNKTEEQMRQEEERKKLVALRDKISYSDKLDQFTTNTLVNYLNGVIFGTGKNDFYDAEFLYRVIEQLSVNEYRNGTDVKDHLSEIISCMHDLFPFGIKTSNYEEIKEFFIEDFVGPDGFINKGIYDYSVYDKMNNISEYSRVMKAISKNETAIENFGSVKDFINGVSKWFISRDEYLGSVLSAIDELDDSVLDVDKYFAGEIDTAKRKAGVYSVSHDDLLEASRLFNKMTGQIQNMSSTIDLLKSEKEKALYALEQAVQTVNEETNKSINVSEQGVQRIIDETEKAIKMIQEERNNSLKKLEEYMNKELDKLLKKLDDYIVILRDNLNVKADAVFSEVLDKYQEQLRDFRLSSENFARANARSLIEIKTETEKSVNTLKELVQNSPKYEEVVKQVEKSSELTDRILELVSQNKDLMESSEYREYKENSSSGVTKVEGIKHDVYTDFDIVIPRSIEIANNADLLDCYNYDMESEKACEAKLKIIEKRKKQREDNGEYFHEKTMEIIKCLLLGQWPYIYGPSGAGKGYIVKQIGELLNQNVVDGGKIGEVHTILGYIDAQGRFRATPAFSACINGDLLFFDEFDNGNSDSRVALNTIFSNLRDKIYNPKSKQYIRFAGEIDVPINLNMRLIAAGNTDGSGIDPDWPDRYPTDESIKERYKVIYVPYDNKVEAFLLRDYKAWYKFLINFREVCEDYSESQEKITTLGNASTRDASDLRVEVCLNAKTMSEIIDEYFVQIKDLEYREAIARAIANKYSIDLDQSNTPAYTDKLRNAEEVDIAKQFVKICHLGIERKSL